MKTAELVNFPARAAAEFPEGGKRALIYVVYDRRGDVEAYIPYALSRLRAHCDHVLVVVNGLLTDAGRQTLEPVADEILVRENRGFDITGYKEGLEHLADRLAEWDEVVLANDTWFGPIGDFAPLFERMDKRPLHFWGMTDHPRVEPNPFTGDSYLAYHLQSYWMAVRRDMFLSEEWTRYWRDLPSLDSYSDAVAKHEAVFTERFVDFGFVAEVAFPSLTDKIENNAVLYAQQLIEAGCPTLKRRPFFQWPPFMDRLSVIGRWTLEAAERRGYPMELIYQDLARNVEPQTLNADAAMLEVLAEEDDGTYDATRPLRTLAVAHIYYPEMTDEIMDRIDTLPGAYDLVITTPEEERARSIREHLSRRTARGSVEVRVLPSNNGRDQAAFLIGCRDELLDGGYDLVVKVHSKKTPQDSDNVGRHFKLQQFENLLFSSGYTANLVALFQRESGLGMAFPPVVHIGHPTLGHGWWANKPGFLELMAKMGVRVPVDEGTPLAPYGSMFFARPEALRRLVEQPWDYDQFGGVEAYVDGGLAHILERVPAYVAGEAGYHTRTVTSPDYMAVSYTALDYNFDQISVTLPPASTMEQIEFLRRAGEFEWGTFRDFLKMYARLHRPQQEDRLLTAYDRSVVWRRRVRRMLRPLRRR